MRKFLSIVCSLFFAVLFGGCALFQRANLNDVQGAKLFDKAERYATEQFLLENTTHQPFANDEKPESICKIIDTEEEYELAFSSFPEEVDFSKDVLIVYLFTDIYYGFDCKLQKVTENGGEITIDVLHEMAPRDIFGVAPYSTSSPIQRCLVVKLSDQPCAKASVKISYPY